MTHYIPKRALNHVKSVSSMYHIKLLTVNLNVLPRSLKVHLMYEKCPLAHRKGSTTILNT